MAIEVPVEDMDVTARANLIPTPDTQAPTLTPEPVEVPSVTPDPVVAEEVKVTPATPQPQPTYNLEEISGGAIKSEEELKEVASKFARMKELEERLQAYEQTPNEPSFANDYLRGLNDWMLKGGDKETYDSLHTVKAGELPHLEALKLKMLYEDSSLDPQDVEDYLISEFKQGEYHDDDDKRLGAVKLSIEGRKAKEFITQMQKEHSLPEPEKKRLQVEDMETKRVAAWEKETPKLLEEFSTFKVTVGDISVDYKPTAEEKVQLSNDFSHIVKGYQIGLDQEGIKEARDLIENRLKLIAYPNILNAIYEQTKTAISTQVDKDIHQPSALKRGDTPPQGDQDPTDALFERQMAGMKGRKVF
jgi:hypothetical protein